MGVIPFYGAADPELFAIERESMDRAGKVVDHLDRVLPAGRVLDIGAGDGFTAERLSTPDRTVVALEPAAGMVRPAKALRWVRGEAECLPFRDASFDAAYATWAYFFPGFIDIRPGLEEVGRVLRPGGTFVMVDNLGDDEFEALGDRPIGTDVDFWTGEGFDVTAIDTAFEFASVGEATQLLRFFFGEQVAVGRRVGFRVGAFSRRRPPAGRR